MKKKYSKEDHPKKTKAAAEAFKGDAEGMMPPAPIQMKEDDSENGIKKGINGAKEAKDYLEYGNVVLENVDLLDDKSILKQAGEGLGKKKLGMDVKGGDPLGKGGKALDYAEIGIDLYDMVDAAGNRNKGKAFKAGTDALVKTIGMMGPIGAAFSTGFEVGTFLDEKTGASDEVYNAMGLKEKAGKDSFEAKTWNLESEKKMKILNIEKKTQFTNLLAIVKSLENSKDSIFNSLTQILSCYPNEHEIPEMPFTIGMPKVGNVKLYTTVRSQTMEMIRLIPELKSYKMALVNYIATLSRLVKIASKESKKYNHGGKTYFKQTSSSTEKEYKKYNEAGNLLEEGTVKVNKKGEIVGGEGIKYKEYNKAGALQEEGVFDYNEKGKKINKRNKKLTIY